MPVVEDPYAEMKDYNSIIGKSDKDFRKDVSKSKPSKLRDDKTGNWRVVKIAKTIQIEEYALSYKEKNIKEGEIHFVVNFNNHTTTRIASSGGLIDVSIMEYVKKEEHYASALGNGMLLAQYMICPDGGIEKL